MKTAAEKLAALWFLNKQEGNCCDYVNEMMEQLKLLGTETCTVTKCWIRNEVKQLLDDLDAHLTSTGEIKDLN
jgi:hypothetical protein